MLRWAASINANISSVSSFGTGGTRVSKNVVAHERPFAGTPSAHLGRLSLGFFAEYDRRGMRAFVMGEPRSMDRPTNWTQSAITDPLVAWKP